MTIQYLRNGNVYRVSIELWKHEWKFGRTRNAVGTRATGKYFHSFFKFSQTFTSVLELDRNTENMFYISFKKHREEKKETTC